MLDEDTLFEDVQTIATSMEISLVDCRLQQSKVGHACHIVIYRQSGIGTDECAKLYRTIMPRLEVLLSSQDIHLEVSTPGTDRKLRLPREYPLFWGKGIAVIERNGTESGGVLTGSDQEKIVLHTKQGIVTIPFADIAKAKLDYTQEVK